MDTFYVLCQMPLLCEHSTTPIAWKILLNTEVNSVNMFFQAAFLTESCIAFYTQKVFYTTMNSFYVCFYVAFL